MIELDAPPKRIGLVLLTAVGDVVHGLPVVHALKQHWPNLHLTWMLQPGPATLVRGHPAVDDIVLLERARGWRAFTALRRELATRPFDLVVNLQTYFKAGIVTGLTQAPVKVGFDRPRARDATWLFSTHRIPPHTRQHTQDEYLEFLAALGVPSAPLEWNLGPWASERAEQQEFYRKVGAPVVAFVVGTSKPEKDWPSAHWARLAEALWTDYGLRPVAVGGTSPREVATVQSIQAASRVPIENALGSGLRRLVGILEGAELVVSPDTGPLHMSVALNRPVISLIGFTNPKRTGPYQRFRDLIVDGFGDTGEDYPISAPHRPGRMRYVTVERVLEKVELWARTYRHPAGR